MLLGIYLNEQKQLSKLCAQSEHILEPYVKHRAFSQPYFQGKSHRKTSKCTFLSHIIQQSRKFQIVKDKYRPTTKRKETLGESVTRTQANGCIGCVVHNLKSYHSGSAHVVGYGNGSSLNRAESNLSWHRDYTTLQIQHGSALKIPRQRLEK